MDFLETIIPYAVRFLWMYCFECLVLRIFPPSTPGSPQSWSATAKISYRYTARLTHVSPYSVQRAFSSAIEFQPAVEYILDNLQLKWSVG